jgi:hypothetical protein
MHAPHGAGAEDDGDTPGLEPGDGTPRFEEVVLDQVNVVILGRDDARDRLGDGGVRIRQVGAGEDAAGD